MWNYLLYLLITCLISFALFLIIMPYKYRPSRYYELLNKIPGPKGYPIIGNALLLKDITNADMIPFIQSLLEEYGPIFKVRAFRIAQVALASVDTIEKVLASSRHITKSSDYDFMIPWLNEGLLLSRGSKWHSHRKLLTPAFHFKILEDYIPILNKNSDTLVDVIRECMNEPYIEINPLNAFCTLDIICETAMGVSINAQVGGEDEYVKAVHRISELVQLRQLSLWYYKDFVYWFSSRYREERKVLSVLHGFTEKVITQRRAEYRARKVCDVPVKKRRLDLLIEISETQQHLTDLDIREEVDTFMFEGHDTISAALSWTMHLLGAHPDIQDKVMDEMNDIFGESDRSPTYEDLGQMKYLEQVIKESLRMFPSVPAYSRLVESEIDIGGYTVPVGANLAVVPLLLHYNPELYPEPEKFDPERFTLDACQQRHPFAYLPFSAGPRGCIGQKFAMHEEKVILSTVLRNFQLESLDRREDILLLMELILRPKDSLRIRFSPRK